MSSEKGNDEGDLHQFVTFNADFNIREMIKTHKILTYLLELMEET